MLKKSSFLFLCCLFSLSAFTEPVKRFQEPVPPYPYEVEEVNFDNESASITLRGTLTLPKGEGPFPAVILIHGSGPWDRDQNLLTHKTFLVLADYFTRQGMAVLRYDKRGIGKSEGEYKLATSKELADDATYAVNFLKTHKAINAKKIGLIGHSEGGGLIAPSVVAQSKDVAFMISLGGSGVNGEEVWCEQGILLQRAAGIEENLVLLDYRLRRKIVAAIKNVSDHSQIEKQIQTTIKRFLALLPLPQRRWMQVYSCAEKTKIAFCSTPWFAYFVTFEPTSVLRHIRIPTLVVFGNLDLVVSPKQNIPVIEQALKEAGNEDFTIIKLEGINHMLQNCQLGTEAEISQIDETVSPVLLKTVSDWILDRTKN